MRWARTYGKKGFDKMKYGYIRVSSKSQKDNYSIKEQRDLVLAAGADEVIEEIYTGGKVYERPRFEALIKRLQAGDTLIVCTRDCGVSDTPRMWHWLNSPFFHFGTHPPHIPVPSAPHICGTTDKIRQCS